MQPTLSTDVRENSVTAPLKMPTKQLCRTLRPLLENNETTSVGSQIDRSPGRSSNSVPDASRMGDKDGLAWCARKLGADCAI